MDTLEEAKKEANDFLTAFDANTVLQKKMVDNSTLPTVQKILNDIVLLRKAVNTHNRNNENLIRTVISRLTQNVKTIGSTIQTASQARKVNSTQRTAAAVVQGKIASGNFANIFRGPAQPPPLTQREQQNRALQNARVSRGRNANAAYKIEQGRGINPVSYVTTAIGLTNANRKRNLQENYFYKRAHNPNFNEAEKNSLGFKYGGRRTRRRRRTRRV